MDARPTSDLPRLWLNRDIDLATKCDLCLGRSAGPACVQMCPHGSAVRISFKDLATVTRTLSD